MVSLHSDPKARIVTEESEDVLCVTLLASLIYTLQRCCLVLSEALDPFHPPGALIKYNLYHIPWCPLSTKYACLCYVPR